LQWHTYSIARARNSVTSRYILASVTYPKQTIFSIMSEFTILSIRSTCI